jgi:hypothetical protein
MPFNTHAAAAAAAAVRVSLTHATVSLSRLDVSQLEFHFNK